MRKAEIFPSKYFKADSLTRKGGGFDTITLTIKGVDTHTFDDGNTQRVLSFEEDERTLGVNKTNWDTIAYISGKDDDEEWLGTRIELYVDPTVRFGGRITPSIRVRAAQGSPPVGNNFPNGVPSEVRAQKAAAPAPASGMSKADAWSAWVKNNPAGKTPQLATDFGAAVKAHESKVGKNQEQFDGSDWSEVADDFIPF